MAMKRNIVIVTQAYNNCKWIDYQYCLSGYDRVLNNWMAIWGK